MFARFEKKIEEWMVRHGNTPKAYGLLGLLSFLESSFFPIPPDVFMVPMIALGKKEEWVRIALITTVTSVVGAVFGYIIGSVLFDTVGAWIVETYHLENVFAYIGAQYEENAFLAILAASATPIPYKAFTISSGFFHLSLVTLVAASVIGRGLRFFAVAYLSALYGEYVAKKFLRHSSIVLLVLIALAVLVLLFF